MACKDSRNKTMEIYTTVASKGYISNIRCPCFRWVVAMAASGCMQSAMSSLWHSGRTVQLANRWSPCSGPRPERRSSAYSMLHVTSTYGTCWKMTHSLWSLREWVLTGNVTYTQVIIKQISLYLSYMVFFFFLHFFHCQGDRHGFVWTIWKTKHIFRSSTGTWVRENRNAVFQKKFNCVQHCRRGEAVGENDDWSLLKCAVRESKYIIS